jgi:hypothetical protein
MYHCMFWQSVKLQKFTRDAIQTTMQYRRQVSYQSDIMIGSWYSEFKQLYVYKVPAQTEVARA